MNFTTVLFPNANVTAASTIYPLPVEIMQHGLDDNAIIAIVFGIIASIVPIAVYAWEHKSGKEQVKSLEQCLINRPGTL
ncbi:hypothetical protein H2203_004126 [Taxawa tesnikishii (nom. ined.)]|nr:hypothetical protein H2203_004126 [Dothideales sp. JES 119]